MNWHSLRWKYTEYVHTLKRAKKWSKIGILWHASLLWCKNQTNIQLNEKNIYSIKNIKRTTEFTLQFILFYTEKKPSVVGPSSFYVTMSIAQMCDILWCSSKINECIFWYFLSVINIWLGDIFTTMRDCKYYKFAWLI